MMNTLEFFTQVLPPEGPYHLRWFTKNRPGQLYTNSLEELAREALKIDARVDGMYFGTASYINNKPGTKANIENVAFKNAYYLDVDIGEGKDYESRKDAVTALAKMLTATGLPQPLIVDSGTGFHFYWPLSAPVPKALWVATAKQLKSTMKNVGFECDRSVTSDPARILRPVGCHHRKTDTPLEVKVLRPAEKILSQEDFEDCLSDEVDVLAGATKMSGIFGASTDMTDDKEFKASDAEAVADHCAFVREFRDTGFAGGGLQPQWYYAMGAIKACTNGEEKAHEWSANADNYSEEHTQQKLDDWGDRGPTTCEYVDDNFGYCDECPYKGDCSAPIQLGQKAAEIIEIQNTDTASGPWWPDGYGWDEAKGEMYALIWNSDEETWDKQYFSTTKFYVETRIRDVDGTWAFRVHRLKYVKEDNEIWENFVVATGLVARGTDLCTEFAKQEVYVTSQGPKNLSNMLKAYGDALRVKQVETIIHKAMGWYSETAEIPKDDVAYAPQATGFIIGNRLIKPDGEEEVILSDHVPENWRNGFGKVGTPSEWARGIHNTYVKHDLVAYQFVILTEFASPLVQLMGREEYRGNPISIVSESGFGKSTACKIAMSIWGNPKLLTLNGNPSQGITPKAFQKKLSNLSNMSPLLDEVTKQQADTLGELVYVIAMGEGREGLRPDRKFIEQDSPWYSLTKITSNKAVMERITETEHDSEEAGDAIQKRVFEMNFIRLGYTKEGFADNENLGNELQTLVNTQYGTVGRIWVRYIMDNMDDIIYDLQNKLVEIRERTIDHAAERFHDYMEACVMVACDHVKKAKLMFPNVEGVQKFITEVRVDMERQRAESKHPMEDTLSRYIAQNVRGILKTEHFPLGKKGRAKDEMPLEDVHGEIVGRIGYNDSLAVLAVSPMKEFCRTRGVDFSKFIRELDALGYFSHDPDLLKTNGGKPEPLRTATVRVNLGLGTAIPQTRTNAIRMDFSRIANRAKLRSVSERHVAEAN